MKKKLHTCFGVIRINKGHALARTGKQFAVTQKLQENICLLAQDRVFEDAAELLGVTMGIDVSAKQIQRISESHGKGLEECLQQSIRDEDGLKRQKTDKLTYVEPDGSMVFTREEGWKEIKVARIFHAEDAVKIQDGRSHVTDSTYVCHIGGHKDFFEKVEHCAEQYSNKVCIGDGARWIWNWASDIYPKMVQILDFFHAMEKLGIYSAIQYRDDPGQRAKWMERQKELLLTDQVEQVIRNVSLELPRGREASKTKEQLLSYYRNNHARMMYGTYREKGYIIGSGAIESAHRNVVQQRIKLSGQRWSINGAQYIVNLRACKKSGQWEQVVNLIRQAA